MLTKIPSNIRHAYHSETTDASVHRKQAEGRLRDRSAPQETLLHLHAFAQPCGGHAHELYSFEEGTLGAEVEESDQGLKWKDKK